jgi:D-arabinono-1,4-lactone oxidase
MAEIVPPLTQVEQLSALLQKVALTAESANQKVNWESILKLLGTDEHSPGDVLNGAGEDTLKELLKFLDIWISGQNKMIPTKWEADYTDLVYCSTVEEVQAKVKECLSNGSILRIAGAQHSTPEAVFAPEGEKAIRVKLGGDLRAIEWLYKDPVNDTITLRVGAGCNLGIDPSDPKSNASNSLTRQLDARGYALPILGGMSHQTIGGYMSTSTAGGSIDFGCADSILAIELVDGQGQVRNLDKAANPDEFNAAAVSMGLFGVFTHITITAGKKYLVKGKEETVLRPNSIITSGTAFLDAVHQNHYVHNVWFAAEFVNSVLQWTGNQVADDPGNPVVPYVHPLESRNMNYAAATTFLATAWLTYDNAPQLAALIFNIIQPVGSSQNFCDHWYRALPNDDLALIDVVIRVQFTEIWIDLEDAQKVFDTLTTLFKNDQFAAGNFGVEIYPGKKSPFWMSMSYGRDVIRIDPYWWEYNVIGDLDEYFDKFWKVLLPFESARLHWGKHWPAVGKTYGSRTIGPGFVEESYPKFGEWKALRAQFDPKNVFVTKYWNNLLGLEAE